MNYADRSFNNVMIYVVHIMQKHTDIKLLKFKLKGSYHTRMLSFPSKMEATFFIKFSRWSRNSTSHCEPVTRNPFLFHFSKHFSISCWLRAHICTDAPNSASSSAIAYLNVATESKIEVEVTEKRMLKQECSRHYRSEQTLCLGCLL